MCVSSLTPMKKEALDSTSWRLFALLSCAVRRRVALSAEFFHQLRHDGKQIADEAIIRDAENRRFFVLVDCDDDLRVLHTSQMLDRAGDADRDVKLRRDDLA